VATLIYKDVTDAEFRTVQPGRPASRVVFQLRRATIPGRKHIEQDVDEDDQEFNGSKAQGLVSCLSLAKGMAEMASAAMTMANQERYCRRQGNCSFLARDKAKPGGMKTGSSCQPGYTELTTMEIRLVAYTFFPVRIIL
jgi:hypothetical protein